MSSAIEASHDSVDRSISSVRDALVGSVTCRPPSGAAGHVPQQPGVHVAEQQVAGLGPLPGAVDVVEDPADLRPGEVGRERQAGLRLVPVLPAAERLRARRRSCRCGCPARRSRCTPACRSFRSQTSAVSRWLVMPTATMSEALRSALASAPAATARVLSPDLLRVVLDPAGLREDLLVLLLVDRHDLAGVAEDHAPGRGGALVDRGYVTRHGLSLSKFRKRPAGAGRSRPARIAPTSGPTTGTQE